MRATADAAEALAGADVVVLAVPSQSLRDNLTAWAPLLPADATLLSLMKGIELGTHQADERGHRARSPAPSPDRVAVLSGPNLAREIAEEQPAATVIACTDTDRGERAAGGLPHPLLPALHQRRRGRLRAGRGGQERDRAGVPASPRRSGFGDNTRASLITRGLAETARLGVALGADPLTFAGLAGLGDLVATCSSPLSRNRTFGEQLGRGRDAGGVAGAAPGRPPRA